MGHIKIAINTTQRRAYDRDMEVDVGRAAEVEVVIQGVDEVALEDSVEMDPKHVSFGQRVEAGTDETGQVTGDHSSTEVERVTGEMAEAAGSRLKMVAESPLSPFFQSTYTAIIASSAVRAERHREMAHSVAVAIQQIREKKRASTSKNVQLIHNPVGRKEEQTVNDWYSTFLDLLALPVLDEDGSTGRCLGRVMEVEVCPATLHAFVA